MTPTIPEAAVNAALDTWLDHEFDGTLNYPRMRNALTAALPFLTGVTRIGYVSAVELVTLQQIETCVDLFTVAQSGPMKFIPVYVASDQLFGNSEQLNDVHTTHTLSEQMTDIGKPITDKTTQMVIAEAIENVWWQTRDCDVEEIDSIIDHLRDNGLLIVGTQRFQQMAEAIQQASLKPVAGIPVSAPSPRAQALEEAAKVADKGNTGWLKKRDVTANKKEARDYETMAIACSHVAAAIRALSSQPGADHIAAAGKMVEGNGWLPIETCPPEHVLFFGVDRHGDKVAVEGFKAVNGTLCVGNKDLKPFTFTHWRPLPASPGASE